MIIDLHSMKDFQEKIGSSSPSLVDFWAPWCGPCIRMHSVLEEAEKDEKLKGIVSFYKVNIDEHPDLAGEHYIVSIPCCLLFCEGKLLGQKVGLMTSPSLVTWVLSLVPSST